MSELDRYRIGRCGCGEITVEVTRLQRGVMHCHCENCRRLTGNFVAAVRVRHDDLVWGDPQGHLAEFDLGYAQYGFCRNCGATLYFQATENPDEVSVMIGLFEDASESDSTRCGSLARCRTTIGSTRVFRTTPATSDGAAARHSPKATARLAARR